MFIHNCSVAKICCYRLDTCIEKIIEIERFIFLAKKIYESFMFSGPRQGIKGYSSHDHGQGGVQQEVRYLRIRCGNPYHAGNGRILLRIRGHADWRK